MQELFQSLGCTQGCHRLSTAFYARVQRDPVLRPLFPGKSLRCAIEMFTAFLVQFLGGPSEDTQFRWYLSLRESHARFKIGPRQRDAWMANMVTALAEVPLEEPARTALRDLFQTASAYLVNAGPAPQVAAESQLWSKQRKLDETVAAIRSGEADRAIALAESLTCSRAVFAHLLAHMIRQSVGLDYVRAKLLADPTLARERFYNRTLLHAAAGAGSLPMVELLLSLAVELDPTAALYCVANECLLPSGASVVRALVQAGAAVDAPHGSKRCTALHMAARRGNVEIARALLDAGATLEVRDSVGVTPWRRAVNCKKPKVAALLLAQIDLKSRRDA